MKKYIVVLFIVIGFTVGMLPLQASASETIAYLNWRISAVTDTENNPVTLSRPLLSFDVEMGMGYFGVHGMFCSEDSEDCMGITGSGYMFDNAGNIEIRIDIRSGVKLFRIRLVDLETLSGVCAIYDYAGNMEAAGSIDMIPSN